MFSRPVLVASVALTGLLALAPAARADNHAWTVAKPLLPTGLMIVGGANLTTLRTSPVVQKMLPVVLVGAGVPADAFDLTQKTCNIDPLAAIDTLVAAADHDGKAAFVVALKSLNETQVEDCMTKLAATKSLKLAIAHTGAVTTYTGLGDKGIAIEWLDKSTFLVASEQDTASLKQMTAGGLTKDKAMAPGLASVKTDAAAWAVVNQPQDITEIKGKLVIGYGNVGLAAGSFSGIVHMVMDSDATATAATTELKKQLADASKDGKLPDSMQALLKSLVIKPTGKDLAITGTISESDLGSLITHALLH